MTQHLGLGDLGQGRRSGTAQLGRDRSEHVTDPLPDGGLRRRGYHAAFPGRPELHDQRLVPPGGVEAFPHEVGVTAHEATSPSADTRRSMCSRGVTSVTQ